MAEGPLSTFAERMDRCWIERRFDDLAGFLAPVVVMVAPGGHRLVGADAAIASYREFMTRCEVRRYVTSDHHQLENGDTGVVEYRWSMEWQDGEERHAADGGEALVLARTGDDWQVIWRCQQPG